METVAAFTVRIWIYPCSLSVRCFAESCFLIFLFSPSGWLYVGVLWPWLPVTGLHGMVRLIFRLDPACRTVTAWLRGCVAAWVGRGYIVSSLLCLMANQQDGGNKQTKHTHTR